MLYAAVALQRLRVPLDGRVGLVFVPDEETGGRRGSGFLAATKRLGAHGIGMLTPEPTSGVVWNANRGAITVRVTVHGCEAHVGLLHQGRNAFEDAVWVVTALQRLARRVGRRRTRFHVTPETARRSLMLIGGRVEAGSNLLRSRPARGGARTEGVRPRRPPGRLRRNLRAHGRYGVGATARPMTGVRTSRGHRSSASAGGLAPPRKPDESRRPPASRPAGSSRG